MGQPRQPTAYEAAFPDMIQYLRGLAGHSIDIESPTCAPSRRHARLAGVMSLDAESNLHELRRGGGPAAGRQGHQDDR